MLDPYPHQSFLTAQEVATMLAMQARSFNRWFKETPDFPLPVHGGGAGKRARRVWRKDEVLAWVLTRPRLPRTPESGAQERPNAAK